MRHRSRRSRWIAVPAFLVVLLLGAESSAGHRSERRTPRCFGAAARDPARSPCHNPLLRLAVIPSPRRAMLDPGAPCTRLKADGLIAPCGFGTGPAKARGRFALIGDSHAAHWRSALAVLARRQRWRGYAITRNGCPFTTAGPHLPERFSLECVRWKRELPSWLARHPRVRTVFLAQLTRNAGDFPPATPDPFAARVGAYVDAWRQLPASVKHVIVIRDTPEIRLDTLACVSRSRAQQRPAGRRCAVPRTTARPPDPAAAAAVHLGSPRFQLADLTRFFCGERECYPVVGGVLVYKDITHITPVFAKTLGPYLLREVRQLIRPGPGDSAR
jgi:hypothetical protein